MKLKFQYGDGSEAVAEITGDASVAIHCEWPAAGGIGVEQTHQAFALNGLVDVALIGDDAMIELSEHQTPVAAAPVADGSSPQPHVDEDVAWMAKQTALAAAAAVADATTSDEQKALIDAAQAEVAATLELLPGDEQLLEAKTLLDGLAEAHAPAARKQKRARGGSAK